MKVVDKAALLAIIAPLTGLSSPTSVLWANDPQPMISDIDQAKVTIKLTSIGANGIDEARYTFTDNSELSPPAPSLFETSEVGQRDVVLSLRAEVFEAGAEAVEILDAVRTGLRKQSTADALNGILLAVQTMEPTVDLPTTYDNRVVSVASMDVKLAGLAQSSETEVGFGWIDTVNTDDEFSTSGVTPA